MKEINQSSQKIRGGVIIPMLTPVTSDGNLDETAVGRLIEYIIKAGVDGIFVLGTTGEAASIPPLMKLRLVELAVKIAANRVQVYSGISDNSFSTSIEAAERYFRLGVDIVVAHLPFCYELNAQEQENYYQVLSKNVDGPIMIYNIPMTTRMSIPVEVIARLSKISNIVGIKDSQNDINRLVSIIESIEDRSKFSIQNGATSLSYRALQIGCDGIVPSLGNIVPGTCKKIYDAVVRGDSAAAETCQRHLDDLSFFMRNGLSLGQSLAAHKTLLSALCICGSSVLPPLQALSDERQQSLKATFLDWLTTISD